MPLITSIMYDKTTKTYTALGADGQVVDEATTNAMEIAKLLARCNRISLQEACRFTTNMKEHYSGLPSTTWDRPVRQFED